MRWSYIFKAVGILIMVLGAAMLPSMGISLYYNEKTFAFLISTLICFICGGLVFGIFRKMKTDYISPREGMAVVGIGWTAMGLFGALPFYLSPEFVSFTDAFYESMSGFTTTGASVITNIESLGKGILFWRSFIQWLGGMGIIVLSLAILPILGIGGMQLYKAEVPSPVPDKLKPRIKDTAMLLWKVYLLITLAQAILLKLGGMGGFDAVCHALTTLPTGGFSTQNASVGQYNNLYFDFIIIFFMLMAGINFSLHYQLLRGKPLAFWKDPECRFFLGLVLVLTGLISFNTYGSVYYSVGEALRYAGFQVVSIVTTTGYGTADYEKWPAMSQVLIFFCMFIGASAGSTGGGMKCLRIMLCVKYCYRELFSLIHPHSVIRIKIGGKSVSDDVMRSILGFLALFVMLFVICSILLAATGVDLLTSIGAVASAIGNIGPGFGNVGPTENYAAIPALGKWLLIWCMLLGRLEIYTLLIFLVPEFWRK